MKECFIKSYLKRRKDHSVHYPYNLPLVENQPTILHEGIYLPEGLYLHEGLYYMRDYFTMDYITQVTTKLIPTGKNIRKDAQSTRKITSH